MINHNGQVQSVGPQMPPQMPIHRWAQGKNFITNKQKKSYIQKV